MKSRTREVLGSETVWFVFLVVTLAFAPLARTEQTDLSDDPDGRLHYTEKDLPTHEKDPVGPSEIEEFARRRGFDYAADTRRAAHGDTKALKKFFELAHDADGAAAESIAGVPTVVYHLLGDEKFAKFLVRAAVVVSDDGAELDRGRWPHGSRQCLSEPLFSADGQAFCFDAR